MDTRELLLIVHIVGAFMLAGGSLTATSLGIYAGAGTSTHSIRVATDLQVRVERFLITPGALLAIVFGILLVLDSEFIDFSEAWISVAFVLWFVSAGLGTGMLTPHAKRVKARADELIAQGVTDSAELQAEFATPRVKAVGASLTLILVVFVCLMVAKPGA